MRVPTWGYWVGGAATLGGAFWLAKRWTHGTPQPNVQAGGEDGLGLGPDYRTPEEKKRDAEKYAKYKKEWLDTPKGKEWQALQQTLSLVHWYRIAVKHTSATPDKPLTITVQKFSGTDDYYPPGGLGKIVKLDRNGAFALAKKVADAFKNKRGTDVTVEWTAAT